MKKTLLLTTLALAISGCMTFNEKMLRQVESIKPLEKPILLETKTGELVLKLNGRGTGEGPFSGTTVAGNLIKMIGLRWKGKGIVSDFGPTGDLKANPDYTLTVSGVRNEEGSMSMAVLGGLSMMLIPTSSTLVYDLDFELVENKTSKKYNVKAKNAVTTTMEILFIPALPFSWIGASNTLSDIADYVYDEFYKQGAFNSGMSGKS